MGFGTYYTIVGAVSAIFFVGVIVDQAYQRLSHKWTNEPPLLPYRIPIIGHALIFGSDCFGLFSSAQYVNSVIQTPTPNALKAFPQGILSRLQAIFAHVLWQTSLRTFLPSRTYPTY